MNTTMMKILFSILIGLMGLLMPGNCQRILSVEDYGAISDENYDHLFNSNMNMVVDLYDLNGLLHADARKPSRYRSEDNHNNHNNTWTSRRLRTANKNKYANDDDNDDPLLDLAITNRNAFNQAFADARPNDTVLVPDGKSFVLIGGVLVETKHGITFDVAGSVHFIHDTVHWPIHWSRSTFLREYVYAAAFEFRNCTNLVLTCSSKTKAKTGVDYKRYEVYLIDADTHRGGLINGYGKYWWDDVIAGRIHESKQTRPRLVHIVESEDVHVEKLTLVNSPFWTLTIEAVRGTIQETNVLIDRQLQADILAHHKNRSYSDDEVRYPLPATQKLMQQKRLLKNYTSGYDQNDTSSLSSLDLDIPIPIDDLPDWIGKKFRQPQDLNTDGIDVYGTDIWINDCIVQNADDSVSVKPSNGRYKGNVTRIPNCTSNITLTNLVLTGFGASVGSVGPTITHNCVNDIKFINITMPGTGKGIYIKSNPSNCSIGQTSHLSNILYENVTIVEPFWWAIWIGPQQQHQPNNEIGMKCPLTWPLPGATHCPTQGCATFENITLRDIFIFHPLISPGVILGNSSNPIKNVVIENLHVDTNPYTPWHGKWPFHDRRYPWRGRIKCKNAFGTVKDSDPSPLCLTKI